MNAGHRATISANPRVQDSNSTTRNELPKPSSARLNTSVVSTSHGCHPQCSSASATSTGHFVIYVLPCELKGSLCQPCTRLRLMPMPTWGEGCATYPCVIYTTGYGMILADARPMPARARLLPIGNVYVYIYVRPSRCALAPSPNADVRSAARHGRLAPDKPRLDPGLAHPHTPYADVT